MPVKDSACIANRSCSCATVVIYPLRGWGWKLSVILCPTEIRSGEEDFSRLDLQPHTVHFRLLSDLCTQAGPIGDSRTLFV